MATQDEIKVGKLFRHKGGKLYKVCGGYTAETRDVPRWREGGKVDCVQWQINEKHPNGREYQASRWLNPADLTAID